MVVWATAAGLNILGTISLYLGDWESVYDWLWVIIIELTWTAVTFGSYLAGAYLEHNYSSIYQVWL